MALYRRKQEDKQIENIFKSRKIKLRYVELKVPKFL